MLQKSPRGEGIKLKSQRERNEHQRGINGNN